MPLDLSSIILNINTLKLSDVSINDLSCNNLNILNSLQSTQNVYKIMIYLLMEVI